MASRESKATRALKAIRASKVTRVLEVKMANKDLRVRGEIWVNLVCAASKAFVVSRD